MSFFFILFMYIFLNKRLFLHKIIMIFFVKIISKIKNNKELDY